MTEGAGLCGPKAVAISAAGRYIKIMEKTVVLVKPDGLQRGLIGEIISRFERKGLKLAGIKMVSLTDEILDDWYVHHKDKDFFPRVKVFMKWTPIVAMVWEGYKVIEVVRRIVGERKGYEAEARSIRGDFGLSGGLNIVHASDSEENAKREIGLMFNKEEIFEYDSLVEELIYDEEEKPRK